MQAVVTGSGDDGVTAWQHAISATYYQQDVITAPVTVFDARLSVWDLGQLSISRIQSPPLTYRRRTTHIGSRVEQHHLVTIPLMGDLFFEQQSKHSHCRARSLLAERGDLPYELHQPNPNELIVLKLPDSLLHSRLPSRTTFGGGSIGAQVGMSALFVDLLQSLTLNADALHPSHHALVEGQLLDLLALVLVAGDGALESSETSIKAAHLRRIMSMVRAQSFGTHISPANIANRCGISVGYLHRLFASTGTSFGRWVLEQRLRASDGWLRDPRCRDSIAAVAYRFGFSDHSQFCRLYKRRFGHRPSEVRAAAR